MNIKSLIFITLVLFTITTSASASAVSISGSVIVLPSDTPSCTKNFVYTPFGNYYDFSYKHNHAYFAGYANSTISPILNTFSLGQIHEIFINEKNLKTVKLGKTLTLEDHYSLKVKSIGPAATVTLTLLFKNREVNTSTIPINGTYIYRKTSGNVTNLPTIAVHVKSRTSNSVTFDGLFQISSKPIKINPNKSSQCAPSHSNKHKWYQPWKWYNDNEDLEDD
jgi:hypothetical protein